MPHARHAQSSLPTRMSGKGFIEPHRSHLPRRARTAKDRTKEEKRAKHTPTPLVLGSPGVQDADADPLGTGATNMTEPPTSGRTIPATPQAPEVLQTTPPLPARPSTPQLLSTNTTAPAPANINDADNDTDDRSLPHPAMGLTMELMNAAQAAVAAQVQEQAQAETVPAPLPLPSLGLSAGPSAPLPLSTTSLRLGPGSPTPPMTAPLGQNLPRRHRRKEVVKSPSPSSERDVSQEKEERKEDDFREEDRRDGEDVTTTTTTPAPTPAPALAADPLAADDEDRPLPHPAMGLTMHLMNAAEAAVTAQAQEQAQAQRTLPPALPLPNAQTLGGISSSMPLQTGATGTGTPPLGLGLGVGLGSPTPPTTAPLTSAAATPLGTNLPRRHRRREVVKSPSPSRERERKREEEEERKGDVDQKDVSGQGKAQPIRVLRFERPAGGVGVGSPPKAGAGASSLPTFPPLGISPKTNNARARPLSTSRSRSRPRARPRASTDVEARHASTSRTREVSERDLRRLAREARRKERGERERRMCVQVLGRDFGVGSGGGVGENGEGEGEVYGGRVEVGFLDDDAEGIEKEEYVLIRAIRPRLGKRMKKRDSISSASSSTSSLTFDSGSSSEESSEESESDFDFDSASESNNELSAIPSWFPWLTTYFPSSSSSSSSTSTSALASTGYTQSRSSRPTTLKLLLKPQPQSTSNNANAKPNKVYDYIEGTSALSEEQIREGCEFMKGWLDDSSEGVDEEDARRTRTRTRIRILSPRNRPEDAFAIGLCYLAWAEKRVQHQQHQQEEDINVDPPLPEGPSSTSPFMISASTSTTSAPISVPTLSIPVSFPSLASALSPAVTDYRSPTSPTTPGPGAGAARLRAHAHAPVRPTFMSRTTSMSTARPGGGVPPVPVTPAGLMARMASLGGGRGVGGGQGGGMGGRGLERKGRMAVVDWGVNDLPPPVSEDVNGGMDVDVDVDVTSTKAEHEREVSADTASITSIPRDESISNSDELDEQPQLLPPPPDIYTLSHLHHLYMRLLDDQEVYHPPESDDTSASVSAVGWMGRGALYEARLKADASVAAVNVGGGLGLDELCLDEDDEEEDEDGEDDYEDEEESTHTAELKESNSDTAGSSLNAEEVRGRLRARGVLVHGREAAMGGRDVSSVGASFGGAFGGGGAVNDVPGQEDEAKVVNRKPSLRGLGLGHKLSLSTIDRKASFRRAKERDARRRERDLRRKEREERRREARAKPVWKGLRDEWRGVLSFEGVQGLVGVWP